MDIARIQKIGFADELILNGLKSEPVLGLGLVKQKWSRERLGLILRQPGFAHSASLSKQLVQQAGMRPVNLHFNQVNNRAVCCLTNRAILYTRMSRRLSSRQKCTSNGHFFVLRSAFELGGPSRATSPAGKDRDGFIRNAVRSTGTGAEVLPAHLRNDCRAGLIQTLIRWLRCAMLCILRHLCISVLISTSNSHQIDNKK